jgi:hypothetical protein
MPNTVTNVGRQLIPHPDLGYEGGSTLHGLVRDIYTVFSNQVNLYWSGAITLANAGTTTITHNLNTPLANLKVLCVQSGAPITEAIKNSFFTVTQVTANQIQILNASGSAKTFEVYLQIRPGITGADLDPGISIGTTGTGAFNQLAVGTYEDFAEVAAPATPSSGNVRLYAKNDKRFYLKGSDGIEQQVGSGTSTGVNYVKNSDFENGTVAGWLTYADAPGLTPVDGIGGTATITFASQSGSNVRGVFSGRLSKGASNLRGDGIAYAFTIDAADKGKSLNIQADFLASSGYALGDVGVFVYDVTNSQLILPTQINVPGGSGSLNASFIATTGTSYRLIFHVASASAAAYTLDIDNVIVAPGVVRAGTAITDWQPFTPTITPITGFLVPSTGFYRRVGDCAEITIEFKKDATAGTGGGQLTFSLPSGLIIDSTKTNDYIQSALGTAIVYKVAPRTTDFDRVLGVIYATSTSVRIVKPETLGILVGTDIQADSQVTVQFKVPVTGWSSNVQIADRALEEFAYNTGSVTSAGASDLVSFGNGNAGTTFNSFNNSTTTAASQTILRCRFISPIQQTDRISIEIYTGIGWVELSGAGFFVAMGAVFNTSAYGMFYNIINGTDVDVSFGNAGRTNNSTTYSGISIATWTNIANSQTYKWRLRKVSAGAQIGGAISTKNVVGRLDGSVVATGYIGETVEDINTTGSSVTGTSTVNIATVTLSPGKWLLTGLYHITNNSALANSNPYILLNNTGASPTVGDDSFQVYSNNSDSVGANISKMISIPPGGVLSYSMAIFPNLTGGSYTARGRVTAVRIA